MNVFDDLTDNEWALVEALFEAQPQPVNDAAAPRRSTRGCQRRAVGSGVRRRLDQAAGPLSVAADLPPPL